jgi:hypothetical protein
VGPAGTAHSGCRGLRGMPVTNRSAWAPASSVTGRIRRASAWTSRKLFSHRSGSGTFRSTTDAVTVVTATSSAPTRSRSGPPARAGPASAVRIGSLKSTLVVPEAAGGPSSAAGSRSSRACTPQQPENDSNLSRSPWLVTTGSARIAAITLAGV